MTNHETAVPTEIDRLHAEILEGRAQISELRDLLRSENQRANAAIDRETTAEQAAIEAEEQARRLGLMVDEYGAGASALTDKLWRVRDLHRKTCLVARSDVPPTSFTCGLCEVLDAPAAVSVPPPAPRAGDRAAVCICGHTEAQHFEDACITEVTGCDCGDFLTGEAAREVIARWREAAIQARADRAAVRAEAFEEAAEKLAALPPEKAALAGESAWKTAAGIVRHMAVQERRMATGEQRPGGPCVAGEQQNETPEAEAPTTTKPETDPLTALTAPALLATIKELRDLRAPLIDALTAVHQSMTSCVGDEWAMEWLGEVWSQLPLAVRAAAGDTDAADELAAGVRQDGAQP